MKYDFAAIEKKWQKRWEETKALRRRHRGQAPQVLRPHRVPLPLRSGPPCGPSPPLYGHGHRHSQKAYGGYNVLYPIGFDAFGLPTENYAIKNHIHPAIVTKQNIANFTSQLK